MVCGGFKCFEGGLALGTALGYLGSAEQSPGIFPIHPCDELEADLFWANCFARSCVRAVAKTSLIHRFDHVQDALTPLDLSLRQETQMRNLCGYKQHG